MSAPAEIDHGRQRTSRLVSGVVTSIGARAVTSLSPLILIPITYGYLGEERYGLWMAVTSLTSMFLWADLGLGNGLMTKLTPALAHADFDEARNLLSEAYRLLTWVTAAGLTILALCLPTLPWATLFNATSTTDARGIAGVCLAAFVVNIPMALIHRIYFAQQRVSSSNLLSVVGAVAALGLGAAAVTAEAPSLAVVALVVCAPVVANIVATVLWLRRTSWAHLTWSRTTSHGLLVTGLRFVLIGVLTALALNADYLVIAHTQSVDDVAAYSVIYRVFLALGLLVTIVNLPLWPANADALSRNDRRWVMATTRRMGALSAAATVAAGVLLIVLGDWIFPALSGGEVEASMPLAVSLTVFYVLLAVASPLFMVQNAASVLRPQTIGWAVYLIASVPAKLVVSSRYGFEWVPATSVALYALVILPAAWSGFRRSIHML